jgi:hypothetical protein
MQGGEASEVDAAMQASRPGVGRTLSLHHALGRRRTGTGREDAKAKQNHSENGGLGWSCDDRHRLRPFRFGARSSSPPSPGHTNN